jgi:RNA polymerase sigma-70 factor (ECF subfamily)
MAPLSASWFAGTQHATSRRAAPHRRPPHKETCWVSSDFADGVIALLPRLRRLARALAGNPDAADDLVQAACERAFAARAQYQPGTRLDAWLFRILRNQWIDQHRRTAARGGVHADLDSIDLPAGTDGRDIAETRLMLAKTEAALAALPPEQREVMVLICIEELGYRETADVLGVPIGTVMSRLSRGRRALARILGLDQQGVEQTGAADR